jgi:hypothetical protein
VPIANVQPTAQQKWDLREYQSLRTSLQRQLQAAQDARQHGTAQRICSALWKAATMTSHSGRMRTLRAALMNSQKPAQASLFE